MLIDPDFPFFELSLPARSPIPDIDNLFFSPTTAISSQPNTLHQRLKSFPSLTDISELIVTNNSAQTPPEVFIQPRHNTHSEVAIHISSMRNTAVPGLPPSNLGAEEELNAWNSAVNIFGSSNMPPWKLQSAVGDMLYAEGIFNSVWVDQGTGLVGHPYILDQLWVLSSIRCSQKILLAVEIDGEYKWSRDFTDNQKTKTIDRSRFLINQGLLLYRISSAQCKSNSVRQIQQLWDYISTAEFFPRMNISGYIASNNDLSFLADIALRKFVENNSETYC